MPSDYEPELNAELAKYRKEASLKGFRKGKTPESVLRKMFGKSILADLLNKKLNEAVEEFVRQNNLTLIGGPIPFEENEHIELDLREMQEYTFRFEMGVGSDFEVKGYGPDHSYERFEVEITESMIDDELKNLQEMDARAEEVEEGFAENDHIYFQAVELEGDAQREGGAEASFSVLVSVINDEALRAQVLSAQKGDTVRFNIFTAFDVEEEKVLSDLLQVEPEAREQMNEQFEAVIEKVERMVPTPLNQELFDYAFGEGQVSSEAEARDLLRQNLERVFLRPANSLMYVDIRDRIMEETTFTLPENFLKKWLAYTDEELTEQAIEENIDSFLESTRWSLIRSKLADEMDIRVDGEELEEYFRNKIRGYFGNSPFVNHDFINGMVQRLMENEKSLRDAFDEIFTDKLFHGLAARVTITSKPVSKEAFNKHMEERAKSARPEQEESDAEIAEIETVDAGETGPETETAQ